jgi:polyhydroxyalkanoate synthase
MRALALLAGARAMAGLGIFSVGLLGCAATPIRHPERLPHFDARVSTDDGWEISMFHLPASVRAAGSAHWGTPLLMAHGTSVNRFHFLLGEPSLAEYLAEQGFDVWLFEYRGDRSSRAPDAATWRGGAWSVDEIARHDVPAALDHVRRQTGGRPVYWVGHSLGGVLGSVAAQGERASQIAGLVAIGSPGDFRQPNDLALRAGRLLWLLPKQGQVPTRGVAKAVVPLLDVAPDAPLLHAIYNAENADAGFLLHFVDAAMENIGRGTVEQYGSWIGGSLRSRDGAEDWSRGLAQIRVPVLLMAGRVDHIVPPWTVRAAYDRIGSEDKTWLVLGQGWGTSQDYGHGDLLLGKRAAEEVFPKVAKWLLSRALGRRDAIEEEGESAIVKEREPWLEDDELEEGPEGGQD